jgi:hypothetical protein
MLPVSGAAQLVACSNEISASFWPYSTYTSHPYANWKVYVARSSVAYLARRPTLPQLLSHQAIFNIAKSSTFLEMVLGQKHIE